MNAVPGWTFHDPLWLLLLLLVPVVAWLRRRRAFTTMVVPGADDWFVVRKTPNKPWPIVCAYVGAVALIVAMARPQLLEPKTDYKRQGYDLIIAIDLSTSMYAEDFRRGDVVANRLQAIKPIISAFITQRPDDRIGIVVFGGRAYTFAPLTFDHDWLRKQSARMSIGLIEDGTAVGDAIGVAINRLAEGRKGGRKKDADGDEAEAPEEDAPVGPRQGQFIVLLTDGSSNKGSLDPRQAARLAAAENIPVYTIGAGAEGLIPVPVFDYTGKRVGTEMRQSEIDTLTLRDIAETTAGLFFRATDENAIEDAFRQIDEDNRIDFDASPPLVTREMFGIFALLGTLLLAIAWAGANLRGGRDEVPA
jgi:Ca-activated chloride channel homolog